jgi:SCY1-like protein 2
MHWRNQGLESNITSFQTKTNFHLVSICRDSLAFATEPVFASVANILGYTDNMPEPLNPAIRNYKLHEIEIKYGLLQVCE